MDNFELELELMFNVGELFAYKERIKDEVINPHLSWQSRVSLYKKVRMINERIQFLQIS